MEWSFVSDAASIVCKSQESIKIIGYPSTMDINITKKQLEIAIWLMQQHSSGSLPEQFSVKWKLKEYIPDTGTIVDFEGEQPDITFASLAALENAELLLTVHKEIKPAKKAGAKKGHYYQHGWPKHETMRTFAFLGNMHELDKNNLKFINNQNVSENMRASKKIVSHTHITQLKGINNSNFDVARLIKYCEEINDNFIRENYSSVLFLSRAILDHCPPIFGEKNFKSVADHWKHHSGKHLMIKLKDTLKPIADHSLHKHISNKESLPVKEEIDFIIQLNFLLGQIIEKLHV
jgi:hypothetical protein